MSTSTAQKINQHPAVDALDLENRVKDMYRDVATSPNGDYREKVPEGLFIDQSVTRQYNYLNNI